MGVVRLSEIINSMCKAVFVCGELTSSKFYPLTGTLVKDQSVDCLEMKVDGKLAELFHQGLECKCLLRRN